MNSSRKPLVVALTGGIASGKTAVSDAFASLGVPVVDTDLIARETVERGSPGLEQVRAEFGKRVIDDGGDLDRRALREIVFSDDDARRRLEAILHPLIAAEARRRIAVADAPYALLVVPLLIESGLFEEADRVLVVDVPEQLQIERVMARDGVDREQAEAALKAQAGRRQRLERADDVIDNSGSLDELRTKVRTLDERYRQIAARR